MKITEAFIRKNKEKRFDIVLNNNKTYNNIQFFLNNGFMCYLNSKQTRNGQIIPNDWVIISITETTKKTFTKKENANLILKRTHKNAWTDMQERFKTFIDKNIEPNDFKYHFDGQLNFRSIKSLLSVADLAMIRDAFEYKRNYMWRKDSLHKNGRDFSISTKMCEDGIFRAWFSSEYHGCLNGDYYLLLNPTTAVFYEKD